MTKTNLNVVIVLCITSPKDFSCTRTLLENPQVIQQLPLYNCEYTVWEWAEWV